MGLVLAGTGIATAPFMDGSRAASVRAAMVSRRMESPLPARSVPGLRLKFNLVLLPLLLAAMCAFLWLDYRHELRAVMAAHSLHVDRVGEVPPSGPIGAETSPRSVAGRSLAMHVLVGGVTLLLLALGINAALAWFVLRPVTAIETAISQMERGHWRLSLQESSGDELGRLTANFRLLGLSLDAQAFQAVYADRLAMLALLSKRVSGRLEPEVARLGRVIGRLADADADQQTRSDVADAAAAILGVIRELERAIDAGVHASQDAVARSRHGVA